MCIQDNALVSAAVLSNRYVSDRFLPDKAIDLVDEACAMIRTEIDSMPAELDEVTRRMMQLEIEEAALTKEKDKASQDRLEHLRQELADALRKATNSDRYDFVSAHRGMFSRLGLGPEHVMALRNDAGIYMIGDSRINVAGLPADLILAAAR